MDRREHHRAQLSLPVRLRWTTPFGQKMEVRETLDVSRGGLLVPCEETHDPGVPLWVTFPYDHSQGDSQPEILAKVVRAMESHNGGHRARAENNSLHVAEKRTGNARGTAVGLHFEIATHPETNGHTDSLQQERRRSLRRGLALPIRVGPEHIPWFEEAMTIDVSAEGLRFLSSREYLPGENLLISFEPSAVAPWSGTTDFRSRVVRVQPAAQTPALAVSVRRVL